jgi:hypothetical protein
MKTTKTRYERRTNALARRNDMGLKVDNASNEDILRRGGFVDEDNRIPSTIRPYRGRSHDSDDRSLGRKIKALAIGTTAVAALGLGAGELYGEGDELPNPADHLPSDITFIDSELQLKNQNPNNGVTIGLSDVEK